MGKISVLVDGLTPRKARDALILFNSHLKESSKEIHPRDSGAGKQHILAEFFCVLFSFCTRESITC